MMLGFSGLWLQDKKRSNSLDLHLEALNVPYLARWVWWWCVCVSCVVLCVHVCCRGSCTTHPPTHTHTHMHSCVARAAPYKAEITQRGLLWVETSTTALFKNNTEYVVVCVHTRRQTDKQTRTFDRDYVSFKSTHTHEHTDTHIGIA